MANIVNYLKNIKNAIYGKDVRGSIHDAIDAINNESVDRLAKQDEKIVQNTTRQDLLENKYDEQIKNIASSEPQNAEIVDARLGFETLGSVIKQKVYHFENVEKMKNCLTLLPGDVCETLGYYEENDGGRAKYVIRLKGNANFEESEENIFVGNTLVAEKITKNKENIKICGAFNIIASRTEEILHTSNSLQDRITQFKNAGINECCITVEIQPSNEEQQAYENKTKTIDEISFRMFPDATTLKTYLDLLTQNNIKVYYLKLHSTWLKDVASDSVEKKMEVYRNVVNKALPLIDYKFDYIGICNEANSFVNYTGIINFINEVKIYGKVLLSGIGQSFITDELLNVVDGYCPHIYTNISYLGEDIDYEFANNRMYEGKAIQGIEKWSLRSNKPIIVGECGCMSYWNALGHAEKWVHTDELIESGAPSVIYIKALLNNLKKYNVTYMNYWWALYGNALNVIKKYKEGK